MKTAPAVKFGTRAGMLLLAFVVTALIGGVDVASANGRDGNRQMNKHNNGHYDDRGNGRHGRRAHRSHEYQERVYLPSSVVYAPPQPPGIGIFFPPIFIHP